MATDDEDDDTTDDAAGGDHITFTEADLMNPQMVALQVGQHCTRPRVADATGRRQGNDLVAARPLLKATLITWLLAMSAERALSQPDEHAADLAALKPCTYDAAGQMQYMDPHLFNNADIVASGLSINWHWFKPVLAPSARWTASWVLSLPKVFVFKAVSLLYWGRSAFQNSRAQHRDPDHRQGLGMIESFVVSNGNAVLWGGTALWASDTVAPTHAGWLYLPLGVAALVAFWRHLHYGMRMMPVPGIVYQPIKMNFRRRARCVSASSHKSEQRSRIRCTACVARMPQARRARSTLPKSVSSSTTACSRHPPTSCRATRPARRSSRSLPSISLPRARRRVSARLRLPASGTPTTLTGGAT